MRENVLENLYEHFEGRGPVLNAFDSKQFPTKIEGTGSSDKVSGHSNCKMSNNYLME